MQRRKKATNKVTLYAEKVINGEIVAGKLVIAACQRHFDDLEKAKSKDYPYYFDEEEAERAIAFFPFLSHSKGEWAGEALLLELWQCFIVGSIYGWLRKEDGLRRFRTAFIEVARKNGKSTLLAGIGLYQLVADGEPGAEVYSAATKKDQARIIFDEAKRMVKKSPSLNKRIEVLKDTLFFERMEARFQPLGADEDTLDGLNVHGGLIDELHAHKTRGVWDVLETATGSRQQPLLIAITTAGFNINGIGYEQHQYCENILNKVFEDDTYFAYIACIDKGDDWTDPTVWAKANPNLGISVKLDDLQRKCDKAKKVPTAVNNFLCKHLNVWTSQAERWMPLDKWKACGGELPDLKNIRCYLGLDLSSTLDLTALSFVFPLNDGQYATFTHFFIPEETMFERVQTEGIPYDTWARLGYLTATPGNVVDYEFIKAFIREQAEQFKIVEIGFDPWNATQIAIDLQNEGFKMVEVRQGFKTLSEPLKTLMALTVSKKLLHDSNPVMDWCAYNMVVRKDPAGNIKPDKEKAQQKIDGMVALVTGLSRALLANQKKRKVITEFIEPVTVS